MAPSAKTWAPTLPAARQRKSFWLQWMRGTKANPDTGPASIVIRRRAQTRLRHHGRPFPHTEGRRLDHPDSFFAAACIKGEYSNRAIVLSSWSRLSPAVQHERADAANGSYAILNDCVAGHIGINEEVNNTLYH
jgi:hypothetical protein